MSLTHSKANPPRAGFLLPVASVLAALVLVAMLVGCGGGGTGGELVQTPAPTSVPTSARALVLVSFYGDSITSGAIKPAPGWLNPRPVARITELAAGALQGVDWSLGGATVQDARDGTPGMPFGPFAQAIKLDASPVVVIRYATANALRFADRLPEYQRALTDMVSQAQAAGKTVVLTGSTHIAAPMPGLSAADSRQVLANVDAFEAATRAVATQTGVLFVDLRAVPFAGAADMADDVHPNQQYSDRVSAHIARALVALLASQ